MQDKLEKKKLPPGYYTACGGRIYDPERYPSVIYRGHRIYFCNKACLRAYEADPDKFMSGDKEHPLESE
jgi:YHS domain-containing protein